jgi:hypothetical protein
MTPSEPCRAVFIATMTAIPIALLSGALLASGEHTAAWGVYAFIALPFVSATAAAWFVHAINAIMIAGILSAIALLAIGWLCDCLPGLLMLWPYVGSATAAGGIVGLFARAILRRIPRAS